jgi:hypothetical protein
MHNDEPIQMNPIAFLVEALEHVKSIDFSMPFAEAASGATARIALYHYRRLTTNDDPIKLKPIAFLVEALEYIESMDFSRPFAGHEVGTKARNALYNYRRLTTNEVEADRLP